MTDGELLHRYAAAGDAEAFAEIVRRHGGMVHAAARRLAREDAEDVTQAVFLLLAQRAGKLARCRNVAGWLYSVTRYCASNARRTRERRGWHLAGYQREAAVTQASASSADDPGASEMLDAAMAKLKEDQRQAVLLRYIEGLSLEESAQRLGITAASVAKRAERGILRLREYFAARGVTLNDAALAATPVSGALLAKLAGMSSGGAGSGGAASAIASGAKTSMATLSAAKVAAAVIVVAVAGVGGAMVAKKVKRATNVVAAVAPTPRAAAATTSNAPVEVGLTNQAGIDLATRFVRALAERDEDALAALAPGEAADVRRDYAIGLLAEVVDGPYARFPRQLEGFVRTSYSTRAGKPFEMCFDTQPPTLADTRRLAVRLRPAGETWHVSEAKILRIGQELNDAGTRPPVAAAATATTMPAQLARASELLRSWDALASANTPEKLDPVDVPRVAAAMKQAEADLPRLPDALRGTSLAFPQESAAVVAGRLRELRETLEGQGVAAFAAKAKEARSDAQLAQAVEQLRRISEAVATNAAAADLAARAADGVAAGPRPPSFAPDIELTMAWDGTKRKVPGPLTVPPWFLGSPAHEKWRQRRNVQNFRTRDDAGNVYEIDCIAVATKDGKPRDIIPAVRMYRPDGTLAAEAAYEAGDTPTSWSMLDATGLRRVFSVMAQPTAGGGDGESWQVMQVSFFDEQENARMWQVSSADGKLVQTEVLNNPVGETIRVLNVSRKLKTATKPSTKAATLTSRHASTTKTK